MANLIEKKYNLFTEEEKKEGIHILFRFKIMISFLPLFVLFPSLSFLFLYLFSCSAHGVPVSYIKSGDPYKSHIEHCTNLISKRLEKLLNNQTIISKQTQKQQIQVILPGNLSLLRFFLFIVIIGIKF